MSDVAVELVEMRPVRVVWSTFDLLVFDDRGQLDVEAYERHDTRLNGKGDDHDA